MAAGSGAADPLAAAATEEEEQGQQEAAPPTMLSLIEFVPDHQASGSAQAAEDDEPMSITIIDRQRSKAMKTRAPSPIATAASMVPLDENDSSKTGDGDDDEGGEKEAPAAEPQTYVALDNETPLAIAEKVGMTLKKLLDFNVPIYGKGLRQKSKLKAGTIIYLEKYEEPEEEQVEEQAAIRHKKGQRIEVQSEADEIWYAALIKYDCPQHEWP